MEGRWLEDFLSVARTGSFSRSAAERHITQSAFSRRIKSLEQWVGTPLIDRSSYPTRLTQAGERFRDVVNQAVSSLHEARQDLRDTFVSRERVVRVAAQHALAGDFLMRWLHDIRDRIDGAAIEVRADNLHDCVREIVEGNVDLLVCYVHPQLPLDLDRSRFPSVRIAESRLVPVSRPDGRGRPVHSLRRSGKAAIPLLHYGSDAFLGRATALALSQLNLASRLRTVYESTLVDSLRAAATAGLGVAWLPLHIVNDALTRGELSHAGAARHEVPLAVHVYLNRLRLIDRHPGLLKL